MMDIDEILEYLPHRYPFLLIDRVLEVIPNKSIVALKNVTANEHFFTGHFPRRMVMPGVLILEALAQTAGVLALKTLNEKDDPKKIYYFAGIDNTRFKRVVIPGDQLLLTVELEAVKQDVWKFKGVASVDDQLVCSTELLTARRNMT